LRLFAVSFCVSLYLRCYCPLFSAVFFGTAAIKEPRFRRRRKAMPLYFPCIITRISDQLHLIGALPAVFQIWNP
jgi:hypothetical protein